MAATVSTHSGRYSETRSRTDTSSPGSMRSSSLNGLEHWSTAPLNSTPLTNHRLTHTAQLRRSTNLTPSIPPDLSIVIQTGDSPLQSNDRVIVDQNAHSTRKLPSALGTDQAVIDETKNSAQFERIIERTANRLPLAEERAISNGNLLDQKLVETSQLQTTLAQQCKELVQLQRAYTELQRASAVRSSSPSRSTVPSDCYHP